jgi:hypothetical protein
MNATVGFKPPGHSLVRLTQKILQMTFHQKNAPLDVSQAGRRGKQPAQRVKPAL